MEMEQERAREALKKKLNEELTQVRFTGQARVFARTHPRTWPSRLQALWNREVELPMLPLGVSLAFLITAGFYFELQERYEDVETAGQAPRREIIEAGGSVYWKDQYEKAVSMHVHDPAPQD